MALAQIGADGMKLGGPVFQHHQNFYRVAEIVMIELIVADAMEFHRVLRRQHEIERRSRRPAVRERSLHAIWCNSLLAHEGDSDVAAGFFWREVKELAHIRECHVVDHGRTVAGHSNSGADVSRSGL